MTNEKRIIYKEKYINRIGETRSNHYGSMMTIDEYNGSKDIWVRFVETGNLVHTEYKAFLKGDVKNVYDKSIYGIGYLGEGDYKTFIGDNHSQNYKTWTNMLMRCYSKKFQEKSPTYRNCEVVDEWLNFQKFSEWFEENYYEVEGQQMNLDKDILHKGNKIYSPETCVFVPKKINMLFVKNNAIRGKLPIGVKNIKNSNKYSADCKNGYGKRIYLGTFDTIDEAFQKYKEFKEKIIKQIAAEYKNIIPIELYEAMLKYEVEFTD